MQIIQLFSSEGTKTRGKKMKNWGCRCLMALFKCESRTEYRKGV